MAVNVRLFKLRKEKLESLSSLPTLHTTSKRVIIQADEFKIIQNARKFRLWFSFRVFETHEAWKVDE